MTLTKEEAADQLREYLPPGSTAYTVLRHVSASGMTRWIDLYAMTEDGPVYLSYQAALVLGEKVNTGKHEGIKRGGCGMDMGFDLVYSVSRAIYPDGFVCIGDRCPSNDHANRETRTQHPEGGYAVSQRWL